MLLQALSLLLPEPLPLADLVQALQGVPLSALAVQPVGLEHAYRERLADSQPEDFGSTP